MKPMLKATGNKRLKVDCNKLLSFLLHFAFKFNLRRYTMAAVVTTAGPGSYKPPRNQEALHTLVY
jgi:hypothetical protein